MKSFDRMDITDLLKGFNFDKYDEEDEEYYCDVQMDEDEFSHVMLSQRKVCPFYRNGDEYEVVKHQAF